MKILAIGDFHGKFPRKFEKLIKKEKIDVVISNGDYPPFSYRKLWFKHCYGTDFFLWEFVGMTKYRKLVMDDHKKGEVALKGLNKLPVPVYTVLGNIDWSASDDISDMNSSSGKTRKNNFPNFDRKDSFAKRLDKYKNIIRFDYKAVKFQDYVFIGMRGGSFPGDVMSKAFRKHRAKLDKLFKNYSKENKNRKVIFISHNVPYNTKLDKITSIDADPSVRGKHYGSKLARRVINAYQPVISIGGHIHEGFGKQKLKKTLAINTGSAHEGKAAIIDISMKGKIKVKFVR
jgi:Icc-related predicted phosphoesterase